MKFHVYSSYAVELTVEADSEEEVRDWLASTTPSEIAAAASYVEETYAEDAYEVGDDEVADYVL